MKPPRRRRQPANISVGESSGHGSKRALLFAINLALWSLVDLNLARQFAPVSAQSSKLQDSSSATSSSCDLLISQSDSLANHCQCNDLDDGSVANQLPPDRSLIDTRATAAHTIGQLTCGTVGLSLAQLVEAVREVKGADYLVNHLSINGQVDLTEESREGLAPKNGPLQAVHLSLQLSFFHTRNRSLSEHTMQTGEKISKYVRNMLSNSEHTVQSLSILLSDVPDTRDEDHEVTSNHLSPACHNQTVISSNGPHESLEIEFDPSELVSRLRSLNRLEISTLASQSSAGAKKEDENSGKKVPVTRFGPIVLRQNMLPEQCQLKWLNLASNNGLVYGSPFGRCKLLEHVNLESNRLAQFLLYDFFATAEFNLHEISDKTLSTILSPNGPQFYYGMPHLKSLNLANNKLRSMSRDLFSGGSDSMKLVSICAWLQNENKVFLLPALNQLDLSRNRLSSMTPTEAALILCTMPNLNQLYLQSNRIIQVSLNALLYSQSPSVSLFSRLEYIDLSQNRLVRVIADNGSSATNQQIMPTDPRVRSINLAHNYLRTPVTPIDCDLLKRISSSAPVGLCDRDDGDELTALASIIDIYDNKTTTICDLISPVRYYQNGTDSLPNELTYSYNSLDQVKATDFDSVQCKLVQVMRLDNNRLARIEEGALNSLISLEELDLSDNYISNLHGELFRMNTKLKTLDLSGNRIKLLNSYIFDTLVDLEEIFLGGNQLAQNLDHQLFKQNALLSTIDLSNNRLERILNSTFASQSNLRLLDLFGNNIKEYLNINYFVYQTASTNLTLGLNLIHLKPTVSQAQQTGNVSASKGKHRKKNQKSAKYRRHKRFVANAIDSEDRSALILSYNNLEVMRNIQKSPANPNCKTAEYTFIRDIECIWLDHNRLTEIPSTAFECAHSLKQIHLQYNSIKTIHPDALNALTNLEVIDLSHNRISNLDYRLFRSNLKSSIRHMDLSWNYLMNIGWLVDAVTLAADKHGNATDLIETNVPLESLTLAHNKLLDIDTDSLVILFSKLTLLRSIDLSATGRIRSGKNTAQVPAQYHLDLLDFSNIRPIEDYFFAAMQDLSVNQLNSASSLMAGIPLSQSKVRAEFLVKILQTTELSHLDLSANNLTNDDFSLIFQHQSSGANLISLDVSSNNLDEWPLNGKRSKQRSSLSKLEILNISANRLRYLVKGQLSSYALSSLRMLNVSRNGMIELIESPTLRIGRLSCFMPQVEVIDLSHNRLTWLPLKFFDRFEQLEVINLSHNNLGPSLPVPTSFDIWTRSLSLDLRWNPRLVGFNTNPGHTDQALHNSPAHKRSFLDGRDVSAHDEEFILAEESSENSFTIKCMTPDEFITSRIGIRATASSQQEARHQMYRQEIGSASSLSDNLWDEYRSIKEEKCSNMIRQIDSINMDSTAIATDRLALRQLAILSTRRVHLSLASKYIRDIESSDTGYLQNVVYLNLADNKLSQLPKQFCQHAETLRSLDLNHNAIQDWPSALSGSCRYLNYLNLSSNHLSGLPQIAFSIRSLIVLDLSKNSISSFELPDNFLSAPFSLKYLDMRYNKLKTDQPISRLVSGSPLTLIHYDPQKTFADDWISRMQLASRFERPRIKLDNSSLHLIWLTNSKVNYTLSLPSPLGEYDQPNEQGFQNRILANNIGSVYREGFVHKIKFCMIVAHHKSDLAQICIQSNRTSSHIANNCFVLKLPPGVPKCLTHLHETPNQSTSTRNQTASNEPGSSHLIGDRTELAALNESPVEEDNDLVLNVINSIRYSWLKLRQLDVNEYLTTLIDTKNDSTWFHIGDRYPVRKMTVIKFMIVIGATSILVLLIMVFVLLVQFSKGKPDHSSPSSDCDLTDDTTTTKEDQLTSASGQGANSHSSSGSSDSSGGSRSDVSKQRNSSLMTKSGSTNSTCMSQRSADLNTVIENNELSEHQRHQQQQQAMYQHRLRQQQNQHAQPYCLTPSLSLAPSSVETAETLQAIDSIQSGHSSGLQESNYQPQSVDSNGQTMSNYGYQQALPTATVMRIVKSSSANFNSNMVPVSSEQAAYGTLDKRYSNYSALKAKMNSLSGQHQQICYIKHNLPEQLRYPQSDWQFDARATQDQTDLATSSMNQNYATLGLNGNRSTEPAHDIDPTTLSLLSINTALSATTATNNNNDGAQFSPANTDAFRGPERDPSSLCEYHRLMRGSENETGGTTGAVWMPPPPPPANIIFEQDEDQHDLYGKEILLHVSQLPPPT